MRPVIAGSTVIGRSFEGTTGVVQAVLYDAAFVASLEGLWGTTVAIVRRVRA